MNSLWNDHEARQYAGDDLHMRVYTSRLLGQDENLVLHGGGNTSVKTTMKDLFNQDVDILYVKGSGWDLATIEAEGFAPVRMDTLLQMAKLDQLTDTEMVKHQRAAMLNPYAPNPSVEAILHAIIPYRFVDHTHADAVVTITNTPDGEQRIKEVYGDRVLYVPYVMPGFILAKTIYEMTKDIDWSQYEGMVLLNHGIFTFHDDAKTSYEKMIQLVSQAEDHLASQGAYAAIQEQSQENSVDLKALAKLRKIVSTQRGSAVLAQVQDQPKDIYFAGHQNMPEFASRGCLTPDHIIRTKRIPLIVGEDFERIAQHHAQEYQTYFDKHQNGEICLDLAPRWAVWPGVGRVVFGRNIKDGKIINDITAHTRDAILAAEHLGGWKALPAKDLFDIEYWELEQAKLNKAGQAPVLEGKIAIVTGAASGIGKSCVNTLVKQGACVMAVDIHPQIHELFSSDQVQTMELDITAHDAAQMITEAAVQTFGGLDILINNVGIFPDSQQIEDLSEDLWTKSLTINLTSHQKLLSASIPYLKEGVDPCVIFVGSKNVPAPGPGASAYSVAKAGLMQLARVAALELGSHGIRVNTIHPNQVFDTAIWTDEVLEKRAKHYGISIEEYKTNNILGVEITSADVAVLICDMVGPNFSKTTGAQIPIDGGNERVI